MWSTRSESGASAKNPSAGPHGRASPSSPSSSTPADQASYAASSCCSASSAEPAKTQVSGSAGGPPKWWAVRSARQLRVMCASRHAIVVTGAGDGSGQE